MRNVSPPRAVLDTNVLITAFLSEAGAPYLLLLRWYAGDFTLVVSNYLRAEYLRVISRPSLRKSFTVSATAIESFVLMLEQAEDSTARIRELNIEVRDPRDATILAAAICGNADYLVTGDDGLLTLAGDERLGQLQIERPRAFLDILIENG